MSVCDATVSDDTTDVSHCDAKGNLIIPMCVCVCMCVVAARLALHLHLLPNRPPPRPPPQLINFCQLFFFSPRCHLEILTNHIKSVMDYRKCISWKRKKGGDGGGGGGERKDQRCSYNHLSWMQTVDVFCVSRPTFAVRILFFVFCRAQPGWSHALFPFRYRDY